VEWDDVPSLRAAWQALQADSESFLSTLSETDLAREYSSALPNGGQFGMLLWKMMLHVANHGTQHRSEVAAMLTAAGRSPGNLDLLDFLMTGG
jgi:uncharacterized damage-inducible protein DinB